ncbi:GntR family transcriptional regulator [Actinomycetota bacterium Odt1-20B]
MTVTLPGAPVSGIRTRNVRPRICRVDVALVYSRTLRGGHPIRQDALAARLDVSRVPLREALRILEAEAVREAAAHLGPELLDVLEEAQEEVERTGASGDVTAMAAANRRFHFALIEASRMPRLVRLISTLWDSTDAYRSLYYTQDSNRERVVHEHRGMLDALRAGDTETAVRLLDEHRAHAVAALRDVIDLAPPG